MAGYTKVAAEPLDDTGLKKFFSFQLPSPAVVALAAVVCVFLLRLPTALVPREFNPDESQMLSQGMKFLVDPVPWRAVDGTTGGPLNSYLISALLLMGFRPGYVLVHLLADVLVGLQVFVAHRTLLRIGTEKAAALGAGLMVFAYGFAGSLDYLHYSSELLPTVLLVCGFYVFMVWLTACSTRRQSAALLLVCGLALGTAPWCKLQALPISGALGLTVLVAIFAIRMPGSKPQSRGLQTIAFCAGAFLPAVIMLAVLAKYSVLKDFWYSYILANFAYAGPISLTGMLLRLLRAISFPPLHQFVLVAMLGVSLLAVSSRVSEVSVLYREQKWVSNSLLIYLAAAVFAIVRPNTGFTHYQIFLVPPMTFITALLASRDSVWARQNRGPELAGARTKVRICTVLCIVLGVACAAYIARYGYTIVGTWRAVRSAPDSNEKIAGVVKDIQRERSVRSLAIWGWEPGVYVLTGIPPATRDSICHFVIPKGSLQPYFRKRYVGDLRDARPDVFIDAVATGAFAFGWDEKDGYESDDVLREFIQKNYVLMGEETLVAGGKPVRVFVRLGP